MARSKISPAKIRSLRRRMGWRQKDLADKLGVSLMTISRWENSIDVPDSDANRGRLLELMATAKGETTT